MILAKANLPVENLQSFVAAAKKSDKPFTFSSAGIGSNSHFVCEQFASHAGFPAAHVPYRGAGPALNAVVAGEVDFAMVPPSAAIFGFQSAGKVKVLAVTTSEASPLAPGIPTSTVAVPGFTHEAWYSLMAPAGLPPAVLEKLNGAVRQVLAQGDVKEQLLATGAIARASSSAEMLDRMKKQVPEFEKVIRDKNIRAE